MNEQDSIFYINKDHLGSFDVITNPDGTVKERYNYDPSLSAVASAKAEQRRRNPSVWSYNNTAKTYYIDCSLMDLKIRISAAFSDPQLRSTKCPKGV